MRPAIPLDPYKEQIIDLVQKGSSANAIQKFLLQTYGVNVSQRTVNHRINQWNLREPRKCATEIDELVKELSRYLDTKEILLVLKEKGIPSSARTLYRIRKRLGIRLRINDPEERRQQMSELENILKSENEICHLESFGQRMTYVHLRSLGLLYTRDQIADAQRRLNPEAIERRRNELHRRIGK